jgi:hypothetical protein
MKPTLLHNAIILIRNTVTTVHLTFTNSVIFEVAPPPPPLENSSDHALSIEISCYNNEHVDIR